MLSLQNLELKTTVPLFIAGFGLNFSFSPIIMTSFFCQSERHRSEGKSIWEDTYLSEKRFQRTQICAVKGHGFGGTVILQDMDLLEDTDLRRGHGSEAVLGFESYIYISVDMIVHILVPIMNSLIAGCLIGNYRTKTMCS